MTIIETIDSAIRDHAVSPDAMRWTPDPQMAAPIVPRIHIEPPTPEQIAEMSARWQATMEPVWQAMQRMGAQVSAAMRHLAPLLDELHRAQQRPTRSERVRRMRTAYGHRRR